MDDRAAPDLGAGMSEASSSPLASEGRSDMSGGQGQRRIPAGTRGQTAADHTSFQTPLRNALEGKRWLPPAIAYCLGRLEWSGWSMVSARDRVEVQSSRLLDGESVEFFDRESSSHAGGRGGE